MQLRDEEIVEQSFRELDQLAGDRGNWESQWTEIAKRVLPGDANIFQSLSGYQSQGEKRTQELYDSTAAIALKRFGAILDSLLTPRNSVWHRLAVDNRELAKSREVRMYFEEVNTQLFKYRYAPTANFSAQNQQNYLSLGAYGTGCVFTDASARGSGLRYRNIHLSEIFFTENHQGMVDGAKRRFFMDGRQILQKWKSRLTTDQVSQFEKNWAKKFEILHDVKPNPEFDPQRKDWRGREYSSFYIIREGKILVEKSGYEEFPYAVSRYEQFGGETYGRGPAMDVLPAIKTLNEEKKTILRQGHRVVDPLYLVHDDGIVDIFNAVPGSMISGGVNADGRPLVHTLPTGNIMIGKDLMDDERSVINDAFLVTIFQILVDNPQMSATEVMERAKEKGILLAPTVGRIHSEYHGSMIPREIGILSRQVGPNGRPILPPMPEILKEARGEYKIEYDSPIARAARAEEASGISRTIDYAVSIFNATQDSSVMDWFDFDEILPDLAELQGVKAKWIKTKDRVEAVRRARAGAAQEEQTINALPGAAAMMNAQAKGKKVG